VEKPKCVEETRMTLVEFEMPALDVLKSTVPLGRAIAKDKPATASMQAKKAAIRVTCGC
jgi:hypothetical protein